MALPRKPPLSNTAADKAANDWREYVELSREERRAADWDERIIRAFQTIDEYRALHSYPMTKVTMGIRSMVKTATGNDTLRPGQRFKRMDRILVKLVRHRKMRLSQMEDIGGCRVVFPTLDLVYTTANHVMRRWADSARLTDYIKEPKADGYRGIHIVQRRDGRQIEVQLRTIGQHEWAEAIEIASPRVGFNLKDGKGPDDLRTYFKMAADRIALGEAGIPPDQAIEVEFAKLRERVLPYFKRST